MQKNIQLSWNQSFNPSISRLQVITGILLDISREFVQNCIYIYIKIEQLILTANMNKNVVGNNLHTANMMGKCWGTSGSRIYEIIVRAST